MISLLYHSFCENTIKFLLMFHVKHFLIVTIYTHAIFYNDFAVSGRE